MTVKVSDYNSEWSNWYSEIKDSIWPRICEVALGMEHVGSTSIEGLSAKPIIDIDIIIGSQHFFNEVKQVLEALGYEHKGDLGIPQREVFHHHDAKHPHHLYVCTADSLALKNHLAVRNMLRQHHDLVELYGEIKQNASSKAADGDEYCKMKTNFLIEVLKASGFSQDELNAVREVN